MGSPFGYDSPFMNAMRKAIDLMLLNFLTVLFSLPIVTAGAALSATHYVCVAMRKRECSVVSTFLSAFADNFKSGTLLYLVILGLIVFGFFDYQLAKNLSSVMQSVVQVVLVLECVMLLLVSSWVFPLQARYVNKVFHTIKNAFVLTIAYLPSTILMSILSLSPVIMLLLSEYALPLVLLFGCVMPIYWNTGIYTKILNKIDDDKNVSDNIQS